MSGSNILFVLSGSIACYKACEAISQLVQRGHCVRAVTTAAAQRFVGQATLEGLTGQKVRSELFAPGDALEHIALSRWAHVTVVCPATANLINRMTAGLGDDLAGALLLAHDWKTPLLIAPAMNPAMWNHPATVESVAKLRGWGAHFIPVGTGRTACGEEGAGRLAESDVIVTAVEGALAAPDRRLRVLITSGGTVEPIDAVRVIANSSTGATGAMIAEHFVRRGHETVLLRARSAPAVAGTRDERFSTFADLDSALERLLTKLTFDAVIHAAAVSDFSLARIEVDGVDSRGGGAGKLSSDAAPVLYLQRNPKLLDTLRSRSRNPDVTVVAFKLTHGASPETVKSEIEGYFETGVADLVVHNDLTKREGPRAFPAAIWHARGASIEQCADRQELALKLERCLASGCHVASAAASR